MNRIKLYFKCISYSANIIYRASSYRIFIIFGLNILNTSLTFVNIYIFKYILDALIAPTISCKYIIQSIIGYLSVIVLQYLISSIKSYITNTTLQKAEHIYECEINEKLCHLPLSLIDSSKGKTMIDDVRRAKATAIFVIYNCFDIVTSAYTFIVAYAALTKFNIWFSIIFLVLTIPGIVFRETFDRKAEIMRIQKAPDVRKFSYYRWMLTDVKPAKDVRTYDLTEPIKERYHEEKYSYLNDNKSLDKKITFVLIIAEIIRRSGDFAFTIYLVYQAILGYLSIGDIALYRSFVTNASNSFHNVVLKTVMGYTRTTEIMSRVFDFFSISSASLNGVRPLQTFESLTFDNVYFKYPNTDNYILSGVSFTINKGDKIAIVGINGSGKTTIIKLMLGFYEINSGQILINGYPMSEYDMNDIRKMFSVLFQTFVKYPLTLRDNVAISSLSLKEDDDRIEDVLKKSDVYDDIVFKLEKGLDTYMTRKFDDKGISLSKGQWQKIALSRAYFKNSPIIIFDEPSASLDAEAEDKIFKNFQRISDEKTGIMITHRISAAHMADTIIVLKDGKVVEKGKHNDLVSSPGWYSKLYNLQSKKYINKES